MRVVLDTSVMIRCLMNRAGTRLLDRWDDYEAVFTADLARELLVVVDRPTLQSRLKRFDTTEPLARALALLGEATIVEPIAVRVCRDESDDKLFACALGGRAQYIISEDEDVLAVGEHQGVRVVRPAEFLRILDSPP